MLRIRAEQLDHFADRARDRFSAMMTDYIRESFPDAPPARDPAELAGWVRSALGLCERHGVIMEPEAAQLILLLTHLGLDIAERQAWAHEALSLPISPIGKVRALVDACREQELAEIEELIVYEDLYSDPIEEA